MHRQLSPYVKTQYHLIILFFQVGCCSVPLNPSPTEPPAMASALSISSEAFSPSHGPEVKSYVLMLRVSVSHHLRNNNQIRNGEDDSGKR